MCFVCCDKLCSLKRIKPHNAYYNFWNNKKIEKHDLNHKFQIRNCYIFVVFHTFVSLYAIKVNMNNMYVSISRLKETFITRPRANFNDKRYCQNIEDQVSSRRRMLNEPWRDCYQAKIDEHVGEK